MMIVQEVRGKYNQVALSLSSSLSHHLSVLKPVPHRLPLPGLCGWCQGGALGWDQCSMSPSSSAVTNGQSYTYWALQGSHVLCLALQAC